VSFTVNDKKVSHAANTERIIITADSCIMQEKLFWKKKTQTK